MRPRNRAGEISALYIGAITDEPPTASPPINRKKTKDAHPQAAALPTADMKYKAPSTNSIARRPYLSTGFSKMKEPMIVPIRALATVNPCQKPSLPKKFESDA